MWYIVALFPARIPSCVCVAWTAASFAPYEHDFPYDLACGGQNMFFGYTQCTGYRPLVFATTLEFAVLCQCCNALAFADHRGHSVSIQVIATTRCEALQSLTKRHLKERKGSQDDFSISCKSVTALFLSLSFCVSCYYTKIFFTHVVQCLFSVPAPITYTIHMYTYFENQMKTEQIK